MKSRLLLLAALTAGCSSETKLPPPVAREVDFTADVQPIFAKHCASCHGATRSKAGIRFDAKETVLTPDLVKPGDSAGSTLIHAVMGMHDRKRMPPDPPHLSDEQVGILRAWIDQGAKWPDPPKKQS